MDFSIVNITVGSIDSHTMLAPVEDVRKKTGLDIELTCANSAELEDDILLLSEIKRKIAVADLVLVRCLMDPSRYGSFAKLEKQFDSCKGLVCVFSSNTDIAGMYRSCFKGDDSEYLAVISYLGNRSVENDTGLIYWALARSRIYACDVPEPVLQRNDGIYHPDFPLDIDEDEYLSSLDPSKPTVGIMFVATYWIYRNLKHIDALIRTAESQGMNTIPVFFNASHNNSVSEKNTAEVFERYFRRNGRTIVDAVIMNSPFSHARNPRDPETNFYHRITDVPVIQAMMINGKFTDFEDTKKPGYKKEFAFQTSWVETDGQIVSVPFSETVNDQRGMKQNLPIQDRIDHILRLCSGWCRLGTNQNKDKKVALILYQTRPDLGSIGSAAGLDGPESAVRILRRLKSEGYTVDHVPASGRELVQELLSNVTNNLDWTDSATVRQRSVHLISKKEYDDYFSSIPEYLRGRMEEKWGKPVGEVMTEDGKIIIPGFLDGNILVTVQPMRARMDCCDGLIHDPELVMPHQYLAFYRWIQYGFGADAVIHLGTHGTLEWLPGKSNTLSSKCCPDAILNGMPNIYPFQMDDPGEGLQAKRRSEAVLIGYNCMPMMKAGSYGSADTLIGLVQEFLKTSNTISSDRKKVLSGEIRELCAKESLFDELGWDPGMDDAELFTRLPELNDHLLEADDELVRNGLHILGNRPDGGLLLDYIYAFTRNAHGPRPSLPSELERCGYSGDCRDVIEKMSEAGFSKEICRSIMTDICDASDDLLSLSDYICDDLLAKIYGNTEELNAVVTALDGRYVMPGPSGAPTRAGPDILPSGRNYYGLDPRTIPSRSAWEVGRRNADQMLEKFKNERGFFPTSIGFIIWATDTLKTNGDDVAYALWLMGARPVWTGENVTGLEVIPLEELGRPRVDVSIRITGLFRDTFPNLIDLLDDAVRMISELDEDDDQNRLSAAIRAEISESISKGIPADEARRNASARIFGSAPGTYGSGINKSIEISDWSDKSDLSKVYSEWSCFAYGRGMNGRRLESQFAKRFSGSQAVVKNLPDKEIGMVDMDDVYGYLGGLMAFSKANGNENVEAFVGDTSNTDDTKVRTASAALQLTFRSQVRNPKFIKGLMKHGYAGVSEVSKMTEYIFGWSATGDVVEKWMFDGLAESYLFDDEVYQWMKDENPYALNNMLRRLQEAIERGLWDADEETKEKLKELFIDAEERLEEVTDR